MACNFFIKCIASLPLFWSWVSEPGSTPKLFFPVLMNFETVLLVFRTYALYDRNKIILTCLIIILCAGVIVACVSTIVPLPTCVQISLVYSGKYPSLKNSRLIPMESWGYVICLWRKNCECEPLTTLMVTDRISSSQGKTYDPFARRILLRICALTSPLPDYALAWSPAMIFDCIIFGLTLYKRLQIGRTVDNSLFALMLRDGECSMQIVQLPILISTTPMSRYHVLWVS